MTEESKSVEKAETSEPETTHGPEPLPIWFFVGLILLVYGVLVMIAGLVYTNATTVLASTRPGLWWGAVIVVAGAVFLGIGIHVHRASTAKADKP